MQSITREKTVELLRNIEKKTIAVIGDVMLDRYFWGSVSRVSPEAPVPVIDVENETFHLGGASNVAANLQSFGIEALLCGLIGEDNMGKTFIDIAGEQRINPAGLYRDTTRPTTVKTRVIGNNQQIARLDREVRDRISKAGAEHIMASLKSVNNLSGIIFSDYNKGTLTEEMILMIGAYADLKGIPVFVDPKFDNFFAYKKAFLFKPNRKEARQALGIEIKSKDDIEKAGNMLLQKLEAKNVLLTLGADGMMLFESNGEVSSVATKARHVADVSGAGDTAIATLAACVAGGANIREAAELANYASGAVCEQPGIVSITKEMLLAAISNGTK